MSLVRKTVLAAAALVGLLVIAALSSFAWLECAPRHVPDGQPPMTVLSAGSLPALRQTFNASEGTVRVLAMLSPT